MDRDNKLIMLNVIMAVLSVLAMALNSIMFTEVAGDTQVYLFIGNAIFLGVLLVSIINVVDEVVGEG